MTRRLGERRHYGPHIDRLAGAVHADFHDFQRLYAASQFEREGDPLAAGPEAKWLIELRRGKPSSEDYPSEAVMNALARTDRLGEELRRVADARDKLPEWEPHGELLYMLVLYACVVGKVQPGMGGGWRHVGRGYRQGLALYDGSKNGYDKGMTQAWEIIAPLAVEPDTLRRAEDAGAVDEKALAWARERGLVS